MKKTLLLLLCLVLCPSFAFAEQIIYGYNAYGEYVPIQVGDRHVNYSHNAQGDYVPTSISNPRDYRDTTNIEYGYNSQGDYVPTRTYNPYDLDEDGYYD